MNNDRKSQGQRFTRVIKEFGRWFAPGLGVKRWFFLALAGITMLGVGLGIFLLDLYRTDSTNPTLLTILSYVSLRFLPRSLRVVIFAVAALTNLTAIHRIIWVYQHTRTPRSDASFVSSDTHAESSGSGD